jgi:hypothetical protein
MMVDRCRTIIGNGECINDDGGDGDSGHYYCEEVDIHGIELHHRWKVPRIAEDDVE